MKQVHVVTGNAECINNLYLAVCLQRFFESNAYAFTERESEADVLVLNVCNVFEETPRMMLEYQEVARREPHKRVLVLGCVPGGLKAEDAPANFHVVPYGRLVRDPGLIGRRTGMPEGFALLKADEVLSGLDLKTRLPFPAGESCFITIGSGCEGVCTYCSIKSGRGGSRSVRPEVIAADAAEGRRKGRTRFVLIADDAGCWGSDLGLDLPRLLDAMVAACPEARFVMLDFNPVNLPPLFERLEPFLDRVDYLYLPLQAGSDRILGLMKRGYTTGQVLPLLRRIRRTRPGLYLETDIIVGFPTETRAEFASSVNAAKVFHRAAFVPFVPKADTPAAAYEGRLDPAEMRARMETVRRLSARHGFKAVVPSIAGEGHGGVGKLPCGRSSLG